MANRKRIEPLRRVETREVERREEAMMVLVDY